jgi:hypothetical protein
MKKNFNLAMQLLGVASSLKLHGAFTSINGQDSSICQSVSLSSYWGFGPQAVLSVSVVRAKLRTFNHESFNFKNTEIRDWDVIVA